MDSDTRHRFEDDLRAAEHAAQFGVSLGRAQAHDRHWATWTQFCNELAVDPFLQTIDDPMAILQVFLQRYRSGTIAPNKKPTRARTAEDALRAVGQAFTLLGQPDPRLTPEGKLDFRLRRQLAFYQKEDPPPARVKPIPIAVLQYVMFGAVASQLISSLAIADMITLAFFFLLRPGEYTATPSDTTPFRWCDCRLSCGGRYINTTTASLAELQSADFVTLTFTTQKNGVKGEVLGLARSGHPHFCPVAAAVRRISHLKLFNAPYDTPLSLYFDHHTWQPVKPADITTVLRTAVLALGPATLGFNPGDISARSLRAAGAMALLCARIDTDIIRLLGRWKSDQMLRYLHLQAEPVMRNFSALMLQGGTYTLHPNSAVPEH